MDEVQKRLELLKLKHFVKNFENILDQHLDQQMEEAKNNAQESQKIKYLKSEWKDIQEESPSDNLNILVSWRDGKGNWQCPIRAYFSENDYEYYAIDNYQTIPINAEIWCPIPRLPGEES